MKAKKIIAMFVASVFTISALTACGGESGKTEETKSSVETSGSQIVETNVSDETETVQEISYPEKVSVWSLMSGAVSAAGYKDNNDSFWAQEIERLTGTQVEWTHVTADVAAEKFNLLIASEEYPDAIVWAWPKVEGGIEMYIEDGVIIELTDLIEECMPNLHAYLEERPDLKKGMTNAEGQILYIPTLKDDISMNIYQGPQIRTDWLEKLDLEVPKTTDDLYDVLKAFKTQDPNGNGEADEIPMSGVSFQQTGLGVGNLLWAFDTHYSFYLKDGKVVWGPAEQEFEEGLKYIAKLYDEELLDVDYLLNDRTAMDSKAIADRVGFEFSYQPTKYYSNADFNDGTKVMAGIPFLTTKDNESQMSFNPGYIESVSTSVAIAVTTDCEDPKAFLKWLDTCYGEEGMNAMNFGKEGTHYEYVDGQPQLKEMTPELNADYAANTMMTGAVFPMVQQEEAYLPSLSEWGRNAISTWAASADVSGILPKLDFTAEEQEQITDTLTQLETYADTQMNNVVIGELSIDEWPDVVKKFHDMGIDKVLEVYNAAYQRYLAK